MKANEPHYHDLTRIRGIGEARQSILRKQLNIFHYKDLVNLNIKNALQLLRKKNEAVSEEMLKSWMEEAKILVSDIETISPRSIKNGWQAIATFVVDYQRKPRSNSHVYRTTVHHIQPDSTRFWDRIDLKEYHHWIKQQLADSSKFPNLINRNISHQLSAIIKEVFFKNDTNTDIASGKIELLLYIEESASEVNNLNEVRCAIRCLLKQHHQKEVLEFCQTCQILPTNKPHYFSASIDGITVVPGDYFLWVTAVLNSPHSIPHFKAVPEVSMN